MCSAVGKVQWPNANHIYTNLVSLWSLCVCVCVGCRVGVCFVKCVVYLQLTVRTPHNIHVSLCLVECESKRDKWKSSFIVYMCFTLLAQQITSKVWWNIDWNKIHWVCCSRFGWFLFCCYPKKVWMWIVFYTICLASACSRLAVLHWYLAIFVRCIREIVWEKSRDSFLCTMVIGGISVSNFTVATV